MLLIREFVAQRKGEEICAEMKRRGHRPVWLQVVGDGDWIVLGLEIVSAEPGWTKAIKIDAKDADPNSFERVFDEWRAKVRADLHEGRPSKVVKEAIQRFGSELVEIALRPRTTS